MSSPLISIITICFNASDALRRTIESVNEQTYASIEHLIIDGGSKDGSVALIQGLARRNVRWVSEPDGGIADAFNKGTALARGDYVCYLNAGDIFVGPQVVADSAAEIIRGPSDKPTVYYGDFYSCHDGIRRRHRTSGRLVDFAWDNPINHQSTFVPRTLAQRFPYDPRLQLGMDYDLWLRLLREAEFRKLDFPVAVFALDGRSNDPAWAVHKLVTRRVLWHINRGTRIGTGEVVALLWRILKIKSRFHARRLLGRRLLRTLRQWKARTQHVRTIPQQKAALSTGP